MTRCKSACLSVNGQAFLITARTDTGKTTTVRILDISDWHAQIDPNGPTGGAEALSDYFKIERAGAPNSITLTAGDDFGAAPPISSFFVSRSTWPLAVSRRKRSPYMFWDVILRL